MKRFGLVVVAAALAGIGPAAAQSIDLTKIYGDKFGCTNKNGQEVVVDKMLLLKGGNLVTAMSACEIKSQKPGKGGALVISTVCEDGDGSSTADFTISKAKKKGVFVVKDADGNLMGQVAQCR